MSDPLLKDGDKQITTQIALLSKKIEVLHSSMKVLTTDLHPILRPLQKEIEEEEEREFDIDLVPLAVKIAESKERIEVLVSIINSMIERIEL